MLMLLLLRRPPRLTLTASLVPYPTRFRSNDRRDQRREDKAEQTDRQQTHHRRIGLIGLCQIGREKHRGNPRSGKARRSEEHTSELQSLMRIPYAVFCLKKKI